MVLISTRSRPILKFLVSLGLVFLAEWLLPGPLVAQASQQTDRGVVIHASVTEQTIPQELTDEEAAAMEEGLAVIQRVLCRLGNLVPGDAAEAAPTDVAMGFGMGRTVVCHGDPMEIPDEPPEPVHSSYTIYIRNDLMTVEAPGYPRMVWQAAEGQQSKMWFVDTETGQIVQFGMSGGVAPLRTIEEGTPAGEVDYGASTSLTGRTDERLGYRVREYTVERELRPPGSAQLQSMMVDLKIHARGSAWIAPETPYNDVVAGFFSNFAAGTESASEGALTGLTSSMAELTELGLPLKTVDTTSVRITGGFAYGGELAKTVDTTVITDIRWEDIPDEQFWGDNPPPDGTDPGDPAATPFAPPDDCDCSCDAMRELENLDEDDPDAMAKAMCAQQCVAQWMQCGG